MEPLIQLLVVISNTSRTVCRQWLYHVEKPYCNWQHKFVSLRLYRRNNFTNRASQNGYEEKDFVVLCREKEEGILFDGFVENVSHICYFRSEASHLQGNGCAI